MDLTALTELSQSPLLPIGMLVSVMLLEKLLNWPAQAHPLTLLNSMAITMAAKVHSDPKSAVSQQRISGILAIVVLSLPIAFIVGAVLTFAEFGFFFDGLLLLIALHFQPVLDGSKKIEGALKNHKKALARYQLSRFTLRESESLSELGICKAAIETLLLRFCYQYMSVIFWFFIGGGIAALLYRFVYEMSHTWNIKLDKYQHFGRPVSWLSLLLQWIPVRLTAILFIVAVNISNAFKAIKKQKGNASTHTFLLTFMGGALNVELGGPAYYNRRKIRLPKCGGTRTVELSDIAKARLAIYQTQGLFIALMALVMAGIASQL